MMNPTLQSEERTENPTVITDSLLIHPEDHANRMDEMSTLFRLMTLFCVQKLATNQGKPVSGRSVYRELDTVYENEQLYRQRVYDALDWHVEHDLLTRRDVGPGGKTKYDYQLTKHGNGYLKRHVELVVGLANGIDYETIIEEGMKPAE
jgi:DNA-binding PadR family transcriptional regulator